jgi:hypothetical protein
MMRSNECLTRLDLSSNHLGDKGVSALSLGLGDDDSTNRVTFLSLNNNRIGSTGARALSRVLRSHRFLKELDIGHNHVSPDGCAELFHALCENDVLETLSLEWNRMGMAGMNARSINRRITPHKYMRAVSYAITGESTRHQVPNLLSRLIDASGMDHILVVGTRSNVGFAGGVALGTLLESNQTLTRIDLSHGGIPGSLPDPVCTSAAINRQIDSSMDLMYW